MNAVSSVWEKLLGVGVSRPGWEGADAASCSIGSSSKDGLVPSVDGGGKGGTKRSSDEFGLLEMDGGSESGRGG